MPQTAATQALRLEPKRQSLPGMLHSPTTLPPMPYFVTHVLNDVFGFDQQLWNLTHKDAAQDHHIGRALGRSLVINRHKREDQPQFPSQYYNTSTQP